MNEVKLIVIAGTTKIQLVCQLTTKKKSEITQIA